MADVVIGPEGVAPEQYPEQNPPRLPEPPRLVILPGGETLEVTVVPPGGFDWQFPAVPYASPDDDEAA